MFVHRIGKFSVKFTKSFILFFSFIGHVYYAVKQFCLRRLAISWSNIVKVLFYSGASLVIPVTLISALMASSLALSTHGIFLRYNLHHKALPVTETLLIQDLVPILLAFVLLVQSALNLISHRVKITKHCQSIDEVVLDYILPIMLGTYVSVLLLYVYTILATIFSLFLSYRYLQGFSYKEYVSHLMQSITVFDISQSMIKTLVYGTIVSLTTGYYYYEVALHHLRSRKAVSRILTRGFFWLAIASVYGKFMIY